MRNNDLNGVTTWMEGDSWQTLLQLLQIERTYTYSVIINDFILKIIIVVPSLSSSMQQLNPTVINEQSSNWTCSHCTFLNDNSNQTCDMCSLDRNTVS